MKTAAQLIEEIGNLVRSIWKEKENPEGLSKALNDLAVLNWALAEHQSTFEEQERSMKTEMDLTKANFLQDYTNQGDAVNKAEIKVTIELAAVRREYNKVASALEKVKIIMRANDKVMEAARSRLSLIKQNIEGK